MRTLGLTRVTFRYNNRVMSVVINSLTKLAARWQPLTSRVQLCLHKILRYKNYFLPSVISHANLCLNLLKSPSIAASILDSRHRTELATSHVDTNSSLPFLLSDTSDLVAGRKIHEFGNWWKNRCTNKTSFVLNLFFISYVPIWYIAKLHK